ncbi:prepilin-type N-terminal cleavage/methylation domain-containing protein, partial [Halomonas sp. SIMBA_159]
MRCRGFTLVELVITLVVLAILALGVTSYLGIGSRMYADAALREQVLGQSRFVAERLVRELRNAVPNSVSFSLSSNCLQFR